MNSKMLLYKLLYLIGHFWPIQNMLLSKTCCCFLELWWLLEKNTEWKRFRILTLVPSPTNFDISSSVAFKWVHGNDNFWTLIRMTLQRSLSLMVNPPEVKNMLKCIKSSQRDSIVGTASAYNQPVWFQSPAPHMFPLSSVMGNSWVQN